MQLGVGGEEGGEAGVDDVGGWGRVGEVCRRLGGGGFHKSVDRALSGRVGTSDSYPRIEGFS